MNLKLIKICFAFLVITLFAIFQVILLMVPDILPSHRAPAQAQELAESEESDGDASTNDETEDTEIVADDDSDNSEDIIPEILPPKTSIMRALESYQLNEKRCTVPSTHYEEMKSLIAEHNEHREAYTENKNPENLKSYRQAVKALSLKLVNLKLLEDFEVDESESQDPFSKFDLGELSESPTNSEIQGIWLDKNDPKDLEKIIRCHHSKLEKLSTDAERMRYYKTHMESQYTESLLKNMNSSENLRTLANGFQVQADSADAVTHSEYGMRYHSMAHIQASQIANRYLNSIKANSSATNIQTAQNIMRAELLTLDQQLKIQAQTQLVGNSSAIVAAHKGINQALSVWSPENIHMSQQGSPLVAGQGLPTTTPLGGNPLTSPLSGTTNLYQPPSVGTGLVTTGFQNHQSLLPGTTALQEIQLSNISRPESGLRRTRPESLSHRAHIDPSRVRQDNRYRRPSYGR